MTHTDLRILCLALGFTAVAMRCDGIPQNESAKRAMDFARLVEEFCRAQLPENHFKQSGEG